MEENKVIGVLLAAGKSTRMGTDKLSLSLGSKTIGLLALQVALKSNLDHIVVVTTEKPSQMLQDISMLNPVSKHKWSQVIAYDADKGQAHSLHRGLNAALRSKPSGIMVLLADQPLLTVEVINELLIRYQNLSLDNRGMYVAASFQKILRPPIIFTRESVNELLKLKGDVGARELIRKKKLSGLQIEFENPLDFFDVDTLEDYEALKGVVIAYD